eukprot:scaffold30939_cov303-Skeletonema_menzelii.AAC.1
MVGPVSRQRPTEPIMRKLSIMENLLPSKRERTQQVLSLGSYHHEVVSPPSIGIFASTTSGR